MRVRWTTDAADDLERICDFIAKDRLNPPDASPRPSFKVLERLTPFRTEGDQDVSKGRASWCFPPFHSSPSTKSLARFRCCESCMERNGGRQLKQAIRIEVFADARR